MSANKPSIILFNSQIAMLDKRNSEVSTILSHTN